MVCSARALASLWDKRGSRCCAAALQRCWGGGPSRQVISKQSTQGKMYIHVGFLSAVGFLAERADAKPQKRSTLYPLTAGVDATPALTTEVLGGARERVPSVCHASNMSCFSATRHARTSEARTHKQARFRHQLAHACPHLKHEGSRYQACHASSRVPRRSRDAHETAHASQAHDSQRLEANRHAEGRRQYVTD